MPATRAARRAPAKKRASPKKTAARDVVRVRGAGFHFPEQRLGTFELIKKERPGLLVGDQIRQAIGCLEIRKAGPADTPSTLAAEASVRAMSDAGVEPGELDLVVTVACTPPDFDLWSMPAAVARRIGAGRAECFGMGDAGCAGAFAAIRGVLPMMRDPEGPRRALIAAGCVTPGNHFFPPATIFGDGAGAMVLERMTAAEAEAMPRRPNLVRADFYSHSTFVDAFGTEAGLNLMRKVGRLEPSWFSVSIRDADVYSALRVTNFDLGAQAVRDSLAKAGWTTESLRWLIPDNVSAKVGEQIAYRLGLPYQKVMIENCTRFGHAFVSDVFVNLSTLFEQHPLRSGDRIACIGMGLGQHWGVALLEVP